MATQGYRVHNLVLDILRIVRDAASRNEHLTAAEIFGRLDERIHRYDHDPLWRQLARPDPHEREGAMAQILGQLTELGLVTPHPSREGSSGFERWRVADTWKPLTGNGDGGRDGPPPDEVGTAGGPGGGGGGGLREALGHPVLFAMDRDDFERFLEDLFENRP